MPKEKTKRTTKGKLKSAESGQYVSPVGADPATTYREGRDDYGSRFTATVEGVRDGRAVLDIGGEDGRLPAKFLPDDLGAGETLEFRVTRKG